MRNYRTCFEAARKLPSMAQIVPAVEHLFITEGWHSFGPDYDRTLMHWYKRFMAGWPQIAPRYSQRFRRMWEFWLLSSAASFRARRGQLWQVVLSPNGVVGSTIEVR